MTVEDKLTQRLRAERDITTACAQLYRRASSYTIRTVTGVDLSKGKHAVLRILNEQDGLSLARIADKGGLDRGNVTRIVSALEKEGYLERQVDPGARHGFQIFLTDAGKQAITCMQAAVDEWNSLIFDGLDDEDIMITTRTLAYLSAQAESVMGVAPED